MRGKLRFSVRVGFAAVLALTLLLGFVSRSGARTADAGVAVVTIGNGGSVSEGSQATFTISLDEAASADIVVYYQPSEGSGLQSVAVPQGETSVSVGVPTSDDQNPGPDRTLSVQLTSVTLGDGTSDATGVAQIGSPDTGTASVVDNDWRIGPIVTSPGSASVSESGNKTIDFQVSLQDPNGNAVAPDSGHPVTVQYAVSDGSAKRGTNYSISNPSGQASGTLTFTSGTADVQVTSIDDGVFGNNKNLNVTFSAPQGASFAGGGGNEQATGTITESDPAPLMGISSCLNGPIAGGGVATFPILLSKLQKTSVTASVDYTTADDSTISGDYSPISGTATFPLGTNEVDLHVQTAQNPPAGNRTFHIQLSNPQNVRLQETSASCTITSSASGGGGGGGNGGSVQITDPQPVTQPTSGSTPVSVPLSLTLPSPLPANPGPVTVNWQTKDGTAHAGTDYTGASGSVTWPTGASGPNPTPVTINVIPDAALTQPATFTVTFTSTSATFVGGGSATITIVPAGSTTPLLSVADASGPSKAGSIPVNVTLSQAATQGVTVGYATADGTDANGAKAGTNYTATNGTLTFAPGVTSKTINIPIAANTSSQPNRDFTFSLSNPTGGAVIAVASATVTILNDFVVNTPPPVIQRSSGSAAGTRPQPQPASQPASVKDHLVLVQLLTGLGKVDSKGHVTFQVSCPANDVRACSGTAAFEVGVKAKNKKGKTVVRTLRIASGTYTVLFGRTGSFVAKLTPTGMKLLTTYRRIRVKVTLTSKDGSGAKGVTAWLVTLQAPPAKKKPATTSSTPKKPVVKKK